MSIFSGGCLGRYVQRRLGTIPDGVWKAPFHQVKPGMCAAQDVCEQWVKTCRALTMQFWKGYAIRPWNGKEYIPENIIHLENRLKEVMPKVKGTAYILSC